MSSQHSLICRHSLCRVLSAATLLFLWWGHPTETPFSPGSQQNRSEGLKSHHLRTILDKNNRTTSNNPAPVLSIVELRLFSLLDTELRTIRTKNTSLSLLREAISTSQLTSWFHVSQMGSHSLETEVLLDIKRHSQLLQKTVILVTLACCQLTPAGELVYCRHYLQNIGSLVYKHWDSSWANESESLH